MLVQLSRPAFNESVSIHAVCHMYHSQICVNLPSNSLLIIYEGADTSLRGLWRSNAEQIIHGESPLFLLTSAYCLFSIEVILPDN